MRNIRAFMSGVSPSWVSFAWGVAEGVFFFIVPDVIISYFALQGFSKGLSSAFYTLFGSILGAVFVYFFSEFLHDPHAFLLSVPLITDLQIQTAQFHLHEYGSYGVVFGPTSGIPHKIYSMYAYGMMVPLGQYLWYSAVSRFARFMVVVVVTHGVVRCISLCNGPRQLGYVVYILGWMAIYIAYFFLAL